MLASGMSIMIAARHVGAGLPVVATRLKKADVDIDKI
jgi:hypothetical protein